MRLTTVTAQQITGDSDRWLDALNNALIRWEISTPARVAMFLAQCGHESGGFKHLVENLHYSAASLLATWPSHFAPDEAVTMAYDEKLIGERAYGGRMGNGPEGSGDGFRYRGRGIIQLTGRDNYARCGQAIGLDFVAQPELLEQPEWAAASAGWFWATHGCNALADAGDFKTITQRINGGLNGQADRDTWLAKMRAILGTPAAQPAAPIEDKSTPLPAPQPERKHMPAILATLLPMVLGMFSQRAEATVGKVTGTDPQVAAQFTQSVFGKLGELVGVPVKDDASAVQAVAQLQARTAAGDTAVVQQLEAHALDYLDKIAPLLDKLAAHELAMRKADDDSADKAAARGQKDAVDIGPNLAKWALYIFAITSVVIGGVMITQVALVDDHKVDGIVVGLLTILVYAAARIAESPFRYRFGGTSESSVVDSGNVAVRSAVAKQSPGGK